MTQIDPVQYGRLLASVDALTTELSATRADMKALDKRLADVEDRFRIGKGTLIGLLLALGGAAYGIREGINSLFGGR